MKKVPESMIRWLDKLWEYKIKFRADFRCELGGEAREGLDAHHIIGRRHWWTRWNLRNGICVSRELHEPGKILEWIKENRPKQYRWIIKQKQMIRPGQKPDLNLVLKKLEAA